jgi:hexosaminidase
MNFIKRPGSFIRVGLALVMGGAFLSVPAFAAATTRETLPLLPRPQQREVTAGQLVLRDGLPIVIARSAPARVHEIAEILRDELRLSTGLSAVITSSDAAPVAGAVSLKLVSGVAGGADNPESYTLKIADGVEVSAVDERGLLWGVQTLLQAVDLSRPGSPTLARGKISDQPAYAWRAVMVDPVRSFLDLDFLRRTIRVMSAYKLNILHLHLIDDHAWRFETKAFPLCNRPGEPLYTQAELKELVAFAQRYGVEIIPEFDFPGHAHAAVTAYPDLDCEGKARAMDQAIFCAGKPFTWEFMEKVIAEAAEIFPSKYIHLGADEPFAVKRWSTCPFCQSRMKAKGVTNTTALYHTFVSDLNEMVKRHGRKLMVWNDAITPGTEPMPPKDILIDAWVNENRVKALTEAGYTIVNSSNRPLYLTSYGQRKGFSLRAVLQWNPRVFGAKAARTSDPDLTTLPLPDNARILGGQACAWATEQGLMEQRLYPRLLAVAETLWSGDARGELDGFSARMDAGHWARLHRLGVPDLEALPMETIFTGPDLQAWTAGRATKFGLVDGELRAPPAGATEGDQLLTTRKYQDFILRFERRSDVNTGETGFTIRCAADSTDGAARGFVVHSSAPPGMRIVAGDVSDLKGWNEFELVARGSVVSLTINGYLAWSVVDPSPRAGAIALRAEGNGFEVKNVSIRSLDR